MFVFAARLSAWLMGSPIGVGCCAVGLFGVFLVTRTLFPFVLLVWSVLLCIAALRRHVRSKRRHGASLHVASAANQLSQVEMAIQGCVEYAPNEQIAIEAEIQQYGMEFENSGSWNHEWIERARTISVRPFSLRLDDGTVVSVVGTKGGVVFLDEISRTVIHGTLQTHTATLNLSERATVVGQLSQVPGMPSAGDGYRQSGYRWQIAGAPLWVASESTSDYFQKRAKLHKRDAAYYAAAALLPVVPAFRILDRFAGSVDNAIITSVTKYSDDDDGYYKVCSAGAGRSFCDKRPFIKAGATVFARYGNYSANYGTAVNLTHREFSFLLFNCALLLALTVVLWKKSFRGLSWYRRKSFTKSGSGKLPTATTRDDNGN